MNQDGPSLIIEASPTPPPPAPPPPPEYPNRLMFLQMKKYYLLFFLVVLLSPLLLGLHDTLVPHTVHPGPPKNNKKFILFIRLLLYFKCCWRIALSCVRNIFQNVHGALKYIYIKCLLILLTHVCWFRATGGYICGCGRPSNLVNSGAFRPRGLLFRKPIISHFISRFMLFSILKNRGGGGGVMF